MGVGLMMRLFSVRLQNLCAAKILLLGFFVFALPTDAAAATCPPGCDQVDCDAAEQARQDAIMARVRAALCPQPPLPKTEEMFGIQSMLGNYDLLAALSDPLSLANSVASAAVKEAIKAAKSAALQAASSVCSGGNVNLAGMPKPSLDLPNCGDLEDYLTEITSNIITQVENGCLDI